MGDNIKMNLKDLVH